MMEAIRRFPRMQQVGFLAIEGIEDQCDDGICREQIDARVTIGNGIQKTVLSVSDGTVLVA